MQIGKPRADMFLRWAGRESFFDKGVREVLLRLHPDQWPGFPIDAWSIADSIALAPSERQWSRLFPHMERFPLWTAELLAAIARYRAAAHDREKCPATALDQLIAWRGDRYLFETAPLNPDHEYVVKHNTLAKKPPQDMPQKLREWVLRNSSAPLTIRENLLPPVKWMEGKARSVSPEAYRQAAIKENRRRDAIMREWAPSWLAYLRGPGVTETTPKK